MAAAHFFLLLSLLILFPCHSFSKANSHLSFIHCLSQYTSQSAINITELTFTSNNSDYYSLLLSSIRNLRFVTPATRKPIIIVTPTDELQVQASVLCSRQHQFNLRVRSGGHDYEGLSYRSEFNQPFVILDLVNLSSIAINVEESTAWVQSGAILGELYYKIAEKSSVLGFPAGICPTVGVGGHLSGGGFGTILRKYSLASDNVIDAQLVDVNGNLLDREAMGEDLFWAITGGGGTSFGIIISWKVNLVTVPNIVTVFSISKTISQGAIELVHQWQNTAPALPEDLFIRVVIQRHDENEPEAFFNSLYLGNCDELLKLLAERFPQLGVQRTDCKEMSWIQSVLYFAYFTADIPAETLLDRGSKPERFFKAKSDFVNKAIPKFALEKIWWEFVEDGAGVMILDPYGGKMADSLDSAFPYRQGVLYNIQYFVEWTDGETSSKHMDWIGRLYCEMEPYVSQNPRGAYVNYRDLDLGKNEEDCGESCYVRAENWGRKYFGDNYERLARIKGRVDPDNFFRNEQSIPPVSDEELGIGLLGRRCEGSSSAAEFLRCVLGFVQVL